jgi:MFS family permease
MLTEKETQTSDRSEEKLTSGSYLALLRTNRYYRQLWLAQVVSMAGDWFSLVAVVALTARYTGAAQALAGLLVVRLLPMVVFAPFAGVLADRINRRNLMIGADLGRAVLAASFLLVNSADNVWLIYPLTLLQFSLGTLFDPARSALIPTLTLPAERVTANSLGALTWSVMAAVGAGLGGVVTGFAGAEVAFIIDSLSFIGSAVLITTIPARVAQACDGNCGKIRLGSDIRDGFNYLKKRPPIMAYTIIKPLGALSDGALFTLMGLQARNAYPLGQEGAFSLGLLQLMVGVGSGLGPWLGVRLLRRMGENHSNLQKLIAYTFILLGLGYIFFANTALLPLALLGILVGEIGGGSRWVFSSTLLQLSVEEKFRGRVFAVELGLMNLGNILSALTIGFIMDQLKISVGVAGIGLGALQLGIGLVWLVVATRAYRKPYRVADLVEGISGD